MSSTTYNLSGTVNDLSACVSNVSFNYWSSKGILDTVSSSLHTTTDWVNNVSMKSDSAYSYAASVSQSVFDLSGVVKTVNDMLSSVSLTASHASADILAVNLSLANVSGRC